MGESGERECSLFFWLMVNGLYGIIMVNYIVNIKYKNIVNNIIILLEYIEARGQKWII